MARRRRDLQILWVLVFAAVYWLAFWNHDTVAQWLHDAPLPDFLHRLL
jgi:hypothetical protein